MTGPDVVDHVLARFVLPAVDRQNEPPPLYLETFRQLDAVRYVAAMIGPAGTVTGADLNRLLDSAAAFERARHHEQLDDWLANNAARARRTVTGG